MLCKYRLIVLKCAEEMDPFLSVY